MATTAEAAQLKQLEFVRTASVKAVEKATALATTAADSAPTPVVSAASTVYEKVAPTIEPYAKATLDMVYPRAEAALATVDGKVDTVVTTAKDFYSKSYESANARYMQLQAAVDDGKARYDFHMTAYTKIIEDCIATVKGKLKEASSINAAALVSTRVAELKTMVTSMSGVPKEHLMHHLAQLQSAWTALVARPEVANLLEYSDTTVKGLTARAEGIHDTIVADPRYSELLDKAAAWINWAQATSVGTKLTSVAGPYATAIGQTKYAEAAAPYASRAIEYWKPAPPLEGIKTK